MARLPLWLSATLGPRKGQSVTVDVSLARCRNCGKTKVASDPCGLDHLAALMEFGAHAKASNPAPAAAAPSTVRDIPDGI